MMYELRFILTLKVPAVGPVVAATGDAIAAAAAIAVGSVAGVAVAADAV